MSNQYFQFKQFRIEQGRAAMKVSTDACIQGAWTPMDNVVRSVLDIGCGTGLLSLMLAQRNPGIKIDAIEMDESAYADAVENVAGSPWRERINVMLDDARVFVADKKYDLIICNPPFFQNSLLSDENGRRMARHAVTLSFSQLFNTIQRNLSATGFASVMLPPEGYNIWQQLIDEAGWSIHQNLVIQPRAGLQANRIISLSSPVPKETVITGLMIYDGNTYTEEFANLLSPYYLKL